MEDLLQEKNIYIPMEEINEEAKWICELTMLVKYDNIHQEN